MKDTIVISFVSKLLIISILFISVSKSWPTLRKQQIYIRPQQIHHPTVPTTEYTRIGRNTAIAKTITNGALYSIRNVGNGLHLTAKSGHTTLGPVVSKKWQDTPAQLWEISKLETSRGYSLKPLHNEFNSVTSQLTSNTHSYHSWEFINTNDGIWMIHNVLENKCIKSNGNTQFVTNTICDPNISNQLWELRKID